MTDDREGQASASELSQTYGINPKTVLKWKKRACVEDRKTGPRQPHSTVLSIEEEAVIVAFRRHTLLPLDDGLYFASTDNSSPVALIIAPLPATPRYQPPAGCDGRQIT